MTVEYDADKLWIEICEVAGLHYIIKYDWVVKYSRSCNIRTYI